MPVSRKRVTIAAFAASIALSSCMVVPSFASEAPGADLAASTAALELEAATQAATSEGNAGAWGAQLVDSQTSEISDESAPATDGCIRNPIASDAAGAAAQDIQAPLTPEEGIGVLGEATEDVQAAQGESAADQVENVGDNAGDTLSESVTDAEGSDASTPEDASDFVDPDSVTPGNAADATAGAGDTSEDGASGAGAPSQGGVPDDVADSDASSTTGPDGADGSGGASGSNGMAGSAGQDGDTSGSAGSSNAANGSSDSDEVAGSNSASKNSDASDSAAGSDAVGDSGAVGSDSVDASDGSASQNPALEGALGWEERDGTTYYLDKDGNPVTGLVRIDGAWYYLDPQAGGARATGEVELPNGTYHFDAATGAMVEAGFAGSQDVDKDASADKDATSKDALAGTEATTLTEKAKQTGWVTDEATGKRYYYDEAGKKVTGELAIDGGWYYFDSDTGAMVTGFADIPTPSGTKTVYYDAAGRMTYGEVSTNNAWYYFDRFNGTMARGITDIITNGGTAKTAYYGVGGGIDGQMQYGERNIDGSWYFFDTFDGHMARGITNMTTSSGQAKTAYYGQNGQMQYGEQAIDGGWYYFDTFDGSMARGITDITTNSGAKKTVYYGDDGRMGYGERNVGDGWRYFDDFDGHMVTGLRSIAMSDGSSKTVLYGTDGIMLYGQQYVDGRWRYFDTFNGRMLSSEECRERVLSYIYAAIGTPDSETWRYQEEVREAGGNYCPDGPCYSFIWSCFRQAGMDRFLCDGLITGYPHESFDWMTAHGQASMEPQRGSIVYFYYDDNSLSAGNSATHAEMVVEVGDDYIASIGAITGGIQKRYWDYSHIVGFGTPLY